jgi:hypothetical protein
MPDDLVAVDDARRPVPVPPWQPTTKEDGHLQEAAIRRIQVRRNIEAAMKLQTYPALEPDLRRPWDF